MENLSQKATARKGHFHVCGGHENGKSLKQIGQTGTVSSNEKIETVKQLQQKILQMQEQLKHLQTYQMVSYEDNEDQVSLPDSCLYPEFLEVQERLKEKELELLLLRRKVVDNQSDRKMPNLKESELTGKKTFEEGVQGLGKTNQMIGGGVMKENSEGDILRNQHLIEVKRVVTLLNKALEEKNYGKLKLLERELENRLKQAKVSSL